MNPIILIALHKKSIIPDDSLYLPVLAGAASHDKNLSIKAQPDNTGSNISKKNPYFCELTVMYWAWKNISSKYSHIGLCHYRRYFSIRKPLSMKQDKRLLSVLKREDANKLLKTSDIILPRKRNYYIESLFDHYAHTLHIEPLELTGEIIKEKYKKYYPEFDRLHKRKSAHMFNMFIMRKDFFDDYCKWLFDILFELEVRVKELNLKYNAFHSRFYGRISELLLDIYINTEKLAYTELPVFSPKPTNWIKKGSSFLLAKIAKKKYSKSF